MPEGSFLFHVAFHDTKLLEMKIINYPVLQLKLGSSAKTGKFFGEWL